MKIHKDRYNFSFDHPVLPNYVVKMVNMPDEAAARAAFKFAHGVWPGEIVWVERYVSES